MLTHHAPRGKPVLEIDPETRFVVFYGDQHHAESTKLRGVVRLTTPDAMTIKTVKITLQGKRRVGWMYATGMAAGEVSDKRVFYTDTITLGTTGSHKINKGTIEWPFEFELDPSMSESVEGLGSSWVVYHLQASVSRPSWNTRDITAMEHVRIVRTLGTDQIESSRSRTNQDVWANKVSYTISIPTDTVVFGTSIVADVELSPLRKGIVLEKVDMRLIESITKRIPYGDEEVRHERAKLDEIEVAQKDMDFPEDSRVMFGEDDPENPTMEDERYSFQTVLPLPKSLRECRQDVDTNAITISHKFKLMVNIKNPEGHISQLVCRLPVKVFISPNLPLDESNNIQATPNRPTDAELNSREAAIVPPPEYGRHILDELYSDMVTSGYNTRMQSGANTPYQAGSRRGSEEDISSHSSGTPSQQNGQGEIHPDMLQSRLANLEGARPIPGRTPPAHTPSGPHTPNLGADVDLPVRGTPSSLPSSYFNYQARSASYHSPSLSALSSSVPGLDAQQEAIDHGDLSRVPSYAAATRTPGPVTPFNEIPPTYEQATSRPPSNNPSRSTSPVTRPQAAHVHGSSSALTSALQSALGDTSALEQTDTIRAGAPNTSVPTSTVPNVNSSTGHVRFRGADETAPRPTVLSSGRD